MAGTAQKIRIICDEQGLKISELAHRLETSRQNFNNKLSRDNFQENELVKIAEVLGCEYESFFVMKDGSKM